MLLQRLPFAQQMLAGSQCLARVLAPGALHLEQGGGDTVWIEGLRELVLQIQITIA